MSLSDDVYVRLLALRTGLRHFERWSEQQARAAGLTPAQHQLLLAIRGHRDGRGPTIGEVADQLLLRHHSIVGLVDRADAAGLVRRARDTDDHRIVRLQLTELGAERLEALSALHLEELTRLAAQLPGNAGARVEIAHLRDDSGGGHRVLVDRAWPRGVSRTRPPFDSWHKELAPSAGLHTWYGQAPDRFTEFAARYQAELDQEPARTALEQLLDDTGDGALVLVTSARDLTNSAAAVLKQLLADR